MADEGKPEEAQAKKAQKPAAGPYDTGPEEETIAKVKEILDGIANPDISLPPSKVILLPEKAQPPSEERKMQPAQEQRTPSEQEARPIIIEQGRRSDGAPTQPPSLKGLRPDPDLVEDEKGLRAPSQRLERPVDDRAQRPQTPKQERPPDVFLKEKGQAPRPQRPEVRVERIEPRPEPRARSDPEPLRRSPPTFTSEIPRRSFPREEREAVIESKKNYAPAVPGVASVNLYKCPQCGGFVNPTVSPTCYNCGYTITL